MSTPSYVTYRATERALIHLRWLNKGLYAAEEDHLLEVMNDVWTDMTEDERREIDAEPPRSLIRSVDTSARSTESDVDVLDCAGAPVREFAEVA